MQEGFCYVKYKQCVKKAEITHYLPPEGGYDFAERDVAPYGRDPE